MSLTSLTLAQLLTSENSGIYRNAQGILRALRKCDHAYDDTYRCVYCFKHIETTRPRPTCAQCGGVLKDSKCLNIDCEFGPSI